MAYILSLFVNWTAFFCFLTQYMYALEEFIRYYQVSYWKIGKKPTYEKATLKIWGWDIPRISMILPIFGHFHWVQNVERHLKHILYTQGNFLKVVKSSILSESRDYGSVALKCLTPRFALFAFSLLFTLGKKVFCSAN